jgi:hypothetical protein
VNRLIVLIFASLGVMVFSAVGVKETLGLPLDEIEIVRKRRDDDAVVVAFFWWFLRVCVETSGEKRSSAMLLLVIFLPSNMPQ